MSSFSALLPRWTPEPESPPPTIPTPPAPVALSLRALLPRWTPPPEQDVESPLLHSSQSVPLRDDESSDSSSIFEKLVRKRKRVEEKEEEEWDWTGDPRNAEQDLELEESSDDDESLSTHSSFTSSSSDSEFTNDGPAKRAQNWRSAPRCQHPKCKKFSYFNFPGGERKFCVDHAENGMIDVCVNESISMANTKRSTGPVCQFPSCTKGASFNFLGLTRRKFCSRHRKPGMVSVMRPNGARIKTSAVEADSDSDTASSSDSSSSSSADSSSSSSRSPMTATITSKRVSSTRNNHTQQRTVAFEPSSTGIRQRSGPHGPMCKTPGCQVEATFGIEGSKTKEHCARHKFPFMVNLRKSCSVPDCAGFPWFAFEEDHSEGFCEDHRDDEMLPWHRTRCDTWECYAEPSFGVAIGWPARWCPAHAPAGTTHVFATQ